MFLAGKKANELGHIVLLDPVGAGASRLRTDTANRLMREDVYKRQALMAPLVSCSSSPLEVLSEL